VSIKTDPAGNIKADKAKSGGKIDPVVALIMAIGEHMKSGYIGDEQFTIRVLS